MAATPSALPSGRPHCFFRHGFGSFFFRTRRTLALEDDSAQPQYLQTVVGRGYRFVANISEGNDGQGFSVSPEEFGRAIMAAAGLKPEESEKPPKVPSES